MKILIPAHSFTDDPKSGVETGMWNFPKHLAEVGNKIFVIAVHVELKKETKKSLRAKNIFLYQIYNYKTHGYGRTESFVTFFFAIFLRIFHKFDWIFIIDESKTPFSRFKLGAKLASRILKPNTKSANEIFSGDDWSYDQKNKDVGEGWDKRKIPILYRVFRFIAIRIWYRFFPVARIGENSDILFCEGREILLNCRDAGRKNSVYSPLAVEAYRFDDPNIELIDTGGKFIYLFLGRILRMKGIYYLIEAFKKISSSCPKAELWIIGRSFGEYKDRLNSDIVGYEDKIKILGEKGRSDIVRYIKSSNVVVDPMLWANFSSVALEALYCRKPLIAPLFGNCKDFVVDGESGFLVYSKNVDLLAEKMKYFYDNYDYAQKMGNRGHDFVAQYLTWGKVVENMNDNFKYFDDKEKFTELNRKYEANLLRGLGITKKRIE